MTFPGAKAGMSIWTKANPKVRPDPPHEGHALGFLTEDRGGFAFDGHRLSSLYRAAIQTAFWLILHYGPALSLQKYSNPAAPRALAFRGMT